MLRRKSMCLLEPFKMIKVYFRAHRNKFATKKIHFMWNDLFPMLSSKLWHLLSAAFPCPLSSSSWTWGIPNCVHSNNLLSSQAPLQPVVATWPSSSQWNVRGSLLLGTSRNLVSLNLNKSQLAKVSFLLSPLLSAWNADVKPNDTAAILRAWGERSRAEDDRAKKIGVNLEPLDCLPLYFLFHEKITPPLITPSLV